MLKFKRTILTWSLWQQGKCQTCPQSAGRDDLQFLSSTGLARPSIVARKQRDVRFATAFTLLSSC
jgi:hypothetical protein